MLFRSEQRTLAGINLRIVDNKEKDYSNRQIFVTPEAIISKNPLPSTLNIGLIYEARKDINAEMQ